MRAFVVDAFTDAVFSGNPAGVVLLDAPADAVWMQQVAAEFRHAETAFVAARADGGYDLRWFTPVVEVDLCGHATLASAHVLAAQGASGTIVFHTRSGELTAVVADSTITLDFPAQPAHRTDVAIGLEPALGVDVDEAWTNDVDLLVEVPAAADVLAVAPDLDALRRLPYRGVVITARADTGADHDFVSRFFGPRVGVDEDPVTGSAHCCLGPFWQARLNRSDLVGYQASRRGGAVGVRMEGDRVHLIGQAVTVLRGELIPEGSSVSGG
jgi:PhzF family phenazine biosynthesis protein